jgi:hypothetical protein
MGDKQDVWQGTLALMVLKTLQSMDALHGYGIARRIEQTSGDLLSVNYGTLYPALLKLRVWPSSRACRLRNRRRQSGRRVVLRILEKSFRGRPRHPEPNFARQQSAHDHRRRRSAGLRRHPTRLCAASLHSHHAALEFRACWLRESQRLLDQAHWQAQDRRDARTRASRPRPALWRAAS